MTAEYCIHCGKHLVKLYYRILDSVADRWEPSPHYGCPTCHYLVGN